MKYDDKLIEEAVLALLATFSSDNGHAWKGFDFEVMNRLHEQDLISDPVNKNKSIGLTRKGLSEVGRLLTGCLGLAAINLVTNLRKQKNGRSPQVAHFC
ncbi:DUF6429 family protein [Pseudomonas sp. LB3P31]